VKALSGFLIAHSQMTLTDVCGYIKHYRPRMTDAFLADAVDTI